MGKTSAIATRRYREKAYDQINVIVPKGRKKDIAEYANLNGVTINGMISQLLQEKMGMPEDKWKGKQN